MTHQVPQSVRLSRDGEESQSTQNEPYHWRPQLSHREEALLALTNNKMKHINGDHSSLKELHCND